MGIFRYMSRFINDSVEYYIYYVYHKVLLPLARGEMLCRCMKENVSERKQRKVSARMFRVRVNEGTFRKQYFRRNVSASMFPRLLKLILVVSFTRNQI